ncbi:hypothetical protein AB4Z51_44380 [Bradyrhizobium sp. 2TAF36]|uniref:hypothetical protein n=1 Tax=Bradyrhizobium sp. 2TAF36 TaxID=3233016 RepID=UPI003F919222
MQGSTLWAVRCHMQPYPAQTGLIREALLPVTWIDAVVRIGAAVAAFAAFYVAWFMYEDDERKLRDKIATWWLQFDELRSRTVSRQAAFVVVVAQKANDIADRMFGKALIAKDSIAVAVCLTAGNLYLWPPIGAAIIIRIYAALGAVSSLKFGTADWVFVSVAVLAFACAAAPLVSPRLRSLPRVVMWMFVAYALIGILGAMLMVSVALLYGMPPEPVSSLRKLAATQLVIGVGCLAGAILTLSQVAVVRYAMRWTILRRSEWPIVGGMALVSIPIGIMLAFFVATLVWTPVTLTEVTSSNFLVIGVGFAIMACLISTAVCTENLIRVEDTVESPKLAG